MNYLFIVNKLTELNILYSNNISLHTKFKNNVLLSDLRDYSFKMSQKTHDVFLQWHQNDIKGFKLPSKGDALGSFLHLHKDK